jgi:diacylglycerol kinase
LALVSLAFAQIATASSQQVDNHIISLIVIQEHLNGTVETWMEKVSDEQYHARVGAK